LNFVQEQHSAPDAREALRTYLKKYIASKNGEDWSVDGGSAGGTADPLAAMGFKGKAVAPIPAPRPPAAAEAAVSPRRTGGPRAAAAPRTPPAQVDDNGGGSPARRCRGANAGGTSASPRDRQVSPCGIFTAYLC
jgi:hypothetical protein